MRRATVLALLSTLIAGSLGGLLVQPAPSLAQYDASTCTGNYNLCIENARRSGGSSAPCEALLQQCMRTGTIPDPYNRRRQPVDRR
jgi:hypothetical protein